MFKKFLYKLEDFFLGCSPTSVEDECKKLMEKVFDKETQAKIERRVRDVKSISVLTGVSIKDAATMLNRLPPSKITTVKDESCLK